MHNRSYYYGVQSEQFAFFRIPKLFFSGAEYKRLSAEAKILYGLMLDRMALSQKNGWLDKYDRVYIIFTLEEIQEQIPFDASEGILHHAEGVDFMPANIDLAGTELTLVATMGRENMLSQYIDVVKANYDYILIDCPPSLGMLTINALKAANSVIIPVQAEILPAKGMTLLMQTITKVRKQLNPALEIGGILLNLVMAQTNLAKDIAYMIERDFGGKINIFKSSIPRAVAAAEVPATGKSMFAYDPNSKVTGAYRKLAEEVLELG